MPSYPAPRISIKGAPCPSEEILAPGFSKPAQMTIPARYKAALRGFRSYSQDVDQGEFGIAGSRFFSGVRDSFAQNEPRSARNNPCRSSDGGFRVRRHVFRHAKPQSENTFTAPKFMKRGAPLNSSDSSFLSLFSSFLSFPQPLLNPQI
jgi:hypothetical protein